MAGHDDYPLGVDIEDRYTMQRAMCGDMVFVLTPATVAGVAGVGKAASSRTVEVALKTADGELHQWCNLDITSALSIADSSTPVPTIASTTLFLRGGKANVVITLPTGTYGAGETNTLTMADCNILTYPVVGGTSVETYA